MPPETTLHVAVPSQNRLIWVWVLTAIALVGILFGARIYVNYARTIHRAEERLITQAKVIDENITTNLTVVNLLLNEITRELARTSGTPHLNGYLQQMLVMTPGICTAMINDPQGRCIYSNREDLLGKDFSTRDYFKIPRDAPDKGVLFLSPPYTTLSGKYVINMTKPLVGKQGEFKGIVTITFDPEYFAKILSSTIYTSDNRVSLVHSDGTIFIAIPEAKVAVTGLKVNQPGSAFLRHLAGGTHTSIHRAQGKTLGDTRLFAYLTNVPQGMRIDKQIVVAPSRNLNAVLTQWRVDSGIEVLIYLLFAAMSILVTRTILLRQAKLKKTEAARARLAAIVEFTDDAIISMDCDGAIYSWNLAAERLFKYSLDEVAGRSISLLIPPESLDKEEQNLRRLRSGDRLKNVEMVWRDKYGSLIDVSVTSSPMKDCSGTTDGMALIIRDITEQKLAEGLLRESEQRFRDIAGASADWIWEIDRNCCYTFASGRVKDLLGYEPEEIIGRTPFALMAPEEAGRVQAAFQAIMMRQESFRDLENSLLHKNDEIRHALTSGVPVFDPQGQLCGYRGVDKDITQTKLVEKTLLESRKDLDRAQEVGNIGSWRLDVRQNVLTWSDENHRIFGIPKGTRMTYETFLAVVHQEDRAFVDTQWQAALRGEPYDIEHRLVVDGRIKWVREKAYLEFATDGSLSGGFGITQDITDRKEAVDALQKANDELEYRVKERTHELQKTIEQLQNEILVRESTEKALHEETLDRLRAVEALREQEQLLLQQNRLAAMGEMINNIAHQWRQPLNTLGLVVQQMQLLYDMGSFTGEYLATSVSKSMGLIKHMSQTIDDFRNFFKPDKEMVTFSIREVVERTILLVEDGFTSQRITIDFTASGNHEICGFPNEFSQALLNILMNAKDALLEKCPDQAKITISLSNEEGRAVVTVVDNAGGIPEDILGKIFEPYFTTKGPENGTGVGLFMSKAIIEKNMNGRLTARNTNEGAEFRIEV